MALAVASLIRRHMRAVSRFLPYDGSAKPPFHVALAHGEEVVGWYVNPPPREDCIIMFTTASIYIAEGGEVERISLDGIVDYETPESKTAVSGVVLRTFSGRKLIPMYGDHGPDNKYRDAFSFIRIIHALIRSRRVV